MHQRAEIRVTEEVVRRDLGQLLVACEERAAKAIRAAQTAADTTVELSPEERAEAMASLRDPQLVDRIVADMDGRPFGPGGDRLVFHIAGRAVARAMAAKHMRASTRRAEVAATWHDLRHHHASVLLAEGVNPSKVAERLGHVSRQCWQRTLMSCRGMTTGCAASSMRRSADLLRTG